MVRIKKQLGQDVQKKTLYNKKKLYHSKTQVSNKIKEALNKTQVSESGPLLSIRPCYESIKWQVWLGQIKKFCIRQL